MDLASIVVAVLALGVLVIIHEAGHFVAARMGGMRVSRFSVGFGPALFASRRGGTEFRVGAIPFGGYVQIDGMHPEDGTDPSRPDSFANRPRHLRAAAILAGPAANYVLAFLMLSVFYAGFATEPEPPFEVLQVQSESAAASAGLQEGDVLVGTSAGTFKHYDDLDTVIENAEGAPVRFDVRRGSEDLEISVRPQRSGDDWRIGIAFRPLASRPVDLGVGEAVARAGGDLVKVSGLLLEGLASLVQTPSDVSVSGPVGIVKGLSNQVQRSWVDAFRVVAHLSIMLGFFNLLPIPALDGARLLFLGVGAVRGREVEPRLEAVVHGVGFILLIGLMVVVSWFDIVG